MSSLYIHTLSERSISLPAVQRLIKRASKDTSFRPNHCIEAHEAAALLGRDPLISKDRMLMMKSAARDESNAYGVAHNPFVRSMACDYEISHKAGSLYENVFDESTLMIGEVLHEVYPWLCMRPSCSTASGKLLDIHCLHMLPHSPCMPESAWPNLQLGLESLDLEGAEY